MAAHPYGATFGYDLSSPYSTFVLVGEVKSIGPIDATVGDTKTTHLTSTSAAHTFIAGMIDNGVCTLRIYMTKAEYAALYTTLFAARLTAGFKVTYPLVGSESTASNWTFSGHCNKFTSDEFDVDGDEAVMCSLSIKISGVATFTSGS